MNRRNTGVSLRHLKIVTVLAVAALGMIVVGPSSIASHVPESRRPSTVMDIGVAPVPTFNCQTCHKFDQMFSHPIDVIPTRSIPSQFPLTNGQITCMTCHDDRAAQPHGSISRSGDMFLRAGETGFALCATCHQTNAGGRPAMHGSMPLRAHMQSENSMAATVPAAFGPSASLDRESASCVACHDGLVGPDVDFKLQDNGFARVGGVMPQSHPIGVPYAPGKRGSIALRQISLLDSRIRLFDGRVGCGSCHSLYSSERHLLVMSNQGSALCMSCHAE